MESYELFMDQKDRFLDELCKDDGHIWVTLNPKSLNRYNRGNWFVMFNPKSWGKYKKGFGIHFALEYYRDKKTLKEYIRLPVGVENPLKKRFREAFKADVVESLKQEGISLLKCDLWPNVGFGHTKLIEPNPIELDNQAWERAFNKYVELGEFNKIVADIIKKYDKKGCFIEHLYVPA